MAKSVDTVAALMVGPDGSLPLPWLRQPLLDALGQQQGHALLVHASPGVGALAFAVVLAQSRLCEARPLAGDSDAEPQLACGQCGSCKLFHARVHPDLMVLLPETLRQAWNWPLSGDKPDGEDGKRKPSKQVRIQEVRAVLDWVQKTSSRGRGKAVVLHPADALNLQSANALLKTLEEPAPGTRLILTVSDPAKLLPTVRSRCQVLRLPTPAIEQSLAWLAGQGVAAPQILLAASSGRPLEALEMAEQGMDAASWARLPKAVQQGQAQMFAGWPVPRVLDALQKLCHDAMAVATGGPARFFAADALPEPPAAGGSAGPRAAGRRAPPTTPEQLAALGAWSAELARVSRHAEHPWNEPLLLDALVMAGARAFRGWS